MPFYEMSKFENDFLDQYWKVQEWGWGLSKNKNSGGGDWGGLVHLSHFECFGDRTEDWTPLFFISSRPGVWDERSYSHP